jgi:hypothetical protein
MSIELIGFITIGLGIYSLFRPPYFVVIIFICATLLGSAAAIILSDFGDINISPAHLLLGFLALRLLREQDIFNATIKSVSFGRPGFWLLATVVFSIFSAYFMPRIFAGQTLTFSLKYAYSAPLEPAMANVTQSLYFVGDLACFLLISGYANSLSARKVLGGAALACAGLNLFFAFADLVTYFTGTSELLAFIRNANYRMLNDGEVAGFKRIVGSFTEASSFGSTTLGYFAFTSRMWLLGVSKRVTLPLTLLSLTAILFSTSTTGYVGLAAFLLISYLGLLSRAFRNQLTFEMGVFLFVVPIAVVTALIVIALNDSYLSYLQNLLDTLVLGKMSTDSGIERSSWNSQAIQNLFDTFGFGVGNGSTRASSFPVGVLASLGIFGALLFGSFFVSIFSSGFSRKRDDPLDEAYRQAAKSTCVAWLITASTSGALIDLGAAYFAFAALASVSGRMPATQSLVGFNQGLEGGRSTAAPI